MSTIDRFCNSTWHKKIYGHLRHIFLCCCFAFLCFLLIFGWLVVLWNYQSQGMLCKCPATEPHHGPLWSHWPQYSSSHSLLPFLILIALVLDPVLHNWKKFVFLVMTIDQCTYYKSISKIISMFELIFSPNYIYFRLSSWSWLHPLAQGLSYLDFTVSLMWPHPSFNCTCKKYLLSMS